MRERPAPKPRLRANQVTLWPGHSPPLLRYQTDLAAKTYQNPILRIAAGARLAVWLHNALTGPIIIHWHGVNAPAAMHGHPSTAIAPGGRFDHGFVVRNRSGTYRYHTHAHQLTSKQAYNGLASFFLVEDDNQRRLNKALDLQLGVTDLPLVIQDKQFDAQGCLRCRTNAQKSMMGRLGDIVLTNMTPNATLAVTPRTCRLRLLNGCNARIYGLAFVHGRARLNFTVIGSDGGLIERPELATEVFCRSANGSTCCWMRGKPNPAQTFPQKPGLRCDRKRRGVRWPGRNGGHERRVRRHQESGNGQHRLATPSTRRGVQRAEAGGPGGDARSCQPAPRTLWQVATIRSDGAIERKIDLSLHKMRFLINGRNFDMNKIAFKVKRGAVGVWRIANPAIGMSHPMHLHGCSFQVLERFGSPPWLAATARFSGGRTGVDLGWKDTVLVWPGETVRVAIDFAHDHPGSQTCVFDCHNLEHADAGMMINCRVQA